MSDSLTKWVTNRQSCRLSGWLSVGVTDWLADPVTKWQMDQPLTDWLTYWLTHSLTHWLTNWMSHWLTDWLRHVHCTNSPNYCLYYLTGLFVAGALNSGRVFIWNKKSATVKTTAVLDKIRNVQPGASKSLWFLDVTSDYCLPASDSIIIIIITSCEGTDISIHILSSFLI